MMDIFGKYTGRIAVALALVVSFALFAGTLAQDETANGAPPGGSLLILLLGLGAIFLVGLVLTVRERLNHTETRDDRAA